MTKRGKQRRLIVLAIGCLSAGCSGWQSAMDPASPQASGLEQLIEWFAILCAIVWLAVMLALAAAIVRRRPTTDSPPATRTAGRWVSAATALSALIIAGLTVASYVVTRHISAGGPAPLVVEVRGYQWWWEVRYRDRAADENFITANEIHIPVGRPVRIELAAEDVIHSFWAPNLAGKQDLIPGRDNSLTFAATEPGIYRQQCAEFCGVQHAHMAMLIVGEQAADYERWRAAQVADAAAPQSDEEKAGRDVFLSRPCAACHAIRGTPAAATTGPDLTHVASRRSIAAGMLPLTRGSLAAWIADPQTIKPGNNMPMVSLTAGELNAVAAYLAALK
jgi:cytochrome c oxidase subunit II